MAAAVIACLVLLVALVFVLILTVHRQAQHIADVEADREFFKTSAAALKKQVALFDGDGSGYVGGSRRRRAPAKP